MDESVTTPKENGEKTERDPVSGKFVDGNPGGPGRPKDSFSLITILKNKLVEVPDGYTKTNAELLIEKMIDLSIKRGNDQQIKNILQYVEGMPKQKLEMEGDINVALVRFIDGEVMGKPTDE